MFIRSLGLRLGGPCTDYEVHLRKQQLMIAQVIIFPQVICGVWLKYLRPVTQKGVQPNPPWLRVCLSTVISETVIKYFLFNFLAELMLNSTQ